MRSKFSTALLSHPIPLRDGTLIRTLGQARDLTDKHKNDRFRDPWSRAEPLIEEAEESGERIAIERVTGQVEMILFGAGLLKL
jgi:hypothetical protein